MRINNCRGAVAKRLQQAIMEEVVPDYPPAREETSEGSTPDHSQNSGGEQQEGTTVATPVRSNQQQQEGRLVVKTTKSDEEVDQVLGAEDDDHDDNVNIPFNLVRLQSSNRMSVSEVSYTNSDDPNNNHQNNNNLSPKQLRLMEQIPEGSERQSSWEEVVEEPPLPRPEPIDEKDRSISTSTFSTKVSQAFHSAHDKAHQAGGMVVDGLDPDKTEYHYFASWCFAIYTTFQALGFLVCVFVRHYPTIIVTCPVGIVFVMLGWLLTSGCRRDQVGRFWTIVLLVALLGLSGVIDVLVTSSCVRCVYWSQQTMSLNGGNALANSATASNDRKSPGILWDLMLEDHHHGADNFVGSCRSCLSDFVNYVVKPYEYFRTSEEFDEEEQARKEAEMFNITSVQSSTSVLGDLANWYLYHIEETGPVFLQRFSKKMVQYLADGGNLDHDQVESAIREYLCSPASRIDGPDPNRFLTDLKRPRFTGEKPLNISASALQSIMRGDPLKKLGTNICFMLRFALLVPTDADLEHKPIKYTQLFPSMNEDGMGSRDFTAGLPFLVNPGWDQDIDTEGTSMNRFANAMTIYTRLPYEKKLLYFDTKEEYYAFFRWELEGTLQDEFFFPSWYYHTEKAAAMASFRAKRTRVLGDHLALHDPYSDKTVGDRVFYAGGQRFLTPLKIPGDEAYEYMYPSGPHSYLSEKHADTNCYRYSHKPRAKDLLRMIYKFWPHEAKRNQGKDELITLARFKKRVVEVDYAMISALENRFPFESPGCILYLDPKTKMPMGVWKSLTKELVLPDQGSYWEHAKFYYRVAERSAIATLHVLESHYVWSQVIATANWQTFDKDHPLRTLLKPYTLNAHSTNSAAFNMLIREHGVLTHGSPFTTDGAVTSLLTFWPHINFNQTIPEWLESSNMKSVLDTETLPLYSQGKRLYALHRKFVENFVDHWYPTDEDLLNDRSVIRFWHHVNTYGRHLDPCVCGLASDVFFDEDVWPSFETKRTCKQFLDMNDFGTEKKELITRRRDWCLSTDPYEKTTALHKMNSELCEANPECSRLFWSKNILKPDMGLTELRSKSQFIDFVSTAIWHITAGHTINSDNVHSFSDAEFSGTRMVPDINGEAPRILDVGSYVMGTTIGSLTSVRCAPLMADWMPLYSHLISKQSYMSAEEKEDNLKRMEQIHQEYKFGLLDMAITFFDESSRLSHNQQWAAMNPAAHASSVAV